MPDANELLFSVVVPFLNEERWLARCIRALEAQTLEAGAFEMLFVDNGSTDRSAEIVRACGRIRLLQEERKDPYLARNRAIAAARGKYVVFLDADCMADPTWLAELQTTIEATDCDIVLGYLAHPEGASPLVRAYEFNYDDKLQYMLEGRMIANYFGHGGNMAVRREVFRKLGDFAAMPVVGDTEIIHRQFAAEPGAVLAYARGARVVHAEVERASTLLYKMYECGKYSETLVQAGGFAPLPLRDRIRIVRHSIQTRRYGLWMVGATVVMLALGWLSFGVGRAARRY